MCNAAHYLVEVGSTKELASTVEAAMKAFHQTSLVTQDPLAYARLCSSAALERGMSGDFASAQTLLATARDILRCELKLPPDHEDVWGVMNNLGNLHLSLENYPEALRHHLICKETVDHAVEGNVIMNYENLGRCYTGLGRYGDAMGYFDKVKEQREFGFR